MWWQRNVDHCGNGHVLDIRALARAVALQTLRVLASVSKLMIALAIMQVVNAGVVDLDVPL